MIRFVSLVIIILVSASCSSKQEVSDYTVPFGYIVNKWNTSTQGASVGSAYWSLAYGTYKIGFDPTSNNEPTYGKFRVYMSGYRYPDCIDSSCTCSGTMDGTYIASELQGSSSQTASSGPYNPLNDVTPSSETTSTVDPKSVHKYSVSLTITSRSIDINCPVELDREVSLTLFNSGNLIIKDANRLLYF